MSRRLVALVVAVMFGAAIGAASLSDASTHAHPALSCRAHPNRPRCTTTTIAQTTTTIVGVPVPYRATGNTDVLPSTLVARDEFSVSQLDTTKWSTGWLGSGITPPVQSQELECYDPAQVTISGGALHLSVIAKQETCGGKTRPYASGAINSSGKLTFSYGYFEARIWIDGTTSACANWGAWWLDGQHWPTDGEMDVMECLSGNNNANWHGPEGGGAGHSFGHGGVRTGWHVFAALWAPGVVTSYYDGLKIGSYSSATNITSAKQFLNVMEQVSPEGQYGGPVKVPSELTCDYVRIWQ